MVADIRARFAVYKSDYTDAYNFQCFTSVVFMFFAAFAPAITFGGLMGTYTNGAMGVTEALIAQCICGVLWGLFAGQPMLIQSATGPVLIFESSLYAMLDSLGMAHDFLTIRIWIGACVCVSVYKLIVQQYGL
jgi:hypothetical protein